MSSPDLFMLAAVRCGDCDCPFGGTVVGTDASVGEDCFRCCEGGGGGIGVGSDGGTGDDGGVLCARVITVSPPLAAETEAAVAVRAAQLIAAVSCDG